MTQVVETGTELRQHLRKQWAAVAPAWRERADEVERRGAEVTAAMLERTAPQPGERVLELASGAGDVALAAARIVAPGEVVVSDVVAEMAEIAAARAAERGLTNVTSCVLDLESIDQPAASFDVVLCREGLMFALDPARAVAELYRALRPGGRTAVAVWGARERNPWLGVVFDAVGEQLQRPLPPPGVPGPFSLCDAERLLELFDTAGFEDVVLSEHATPLAADSFDAWWTRTSALAGPLSNVLTALPAPAAEALRERLRNGVTHYLADDGSVMLPGLTLLVSAVRR